MSITDSTQSASAASGQAYYETTVTRLGADASDMADGGVLILFAEPVPPALEDVSVLHRPAAPLDPAHQSVQVGDTIECESTRATVTAVGDLATGNLAELGHIVIYGGDAASTKLLPGAVHTDVAIPLPQPGATLRWSHSPA